MNYMTRDFGEMEISEQSILEFIQPIFGFEEYTKYALIFDPEIGEQIVWLQSLEDKDLCFMLMDPSDLKPYYQPQISDSVQMLLGEGEYICWVIMAVSSNTGNATVNLKSPILMHEQNRTAAQIILDQDYPVRFSL